MFNKKLLNPAPKLGFKGSSPGLVRKKLIRLFFTASWVVYVRVKTPGFTNGIETPNPIFGFKFVGLIYWGLNATIYYSINS